AISIAIIAMPYGAVRRIHLKKCIYHRDTIADRRIFGATQATANKLQEINAYFFIGRDQPAVASVLDLQDLPHRLFVAKHIRWCDPDIIASDPETLCERRIVDDCPPLDTCIPEICQAKSEASGRFGEKFGSCYKRRDADGKRVWADTGILLPAVLRARRPRAREERKCAADHLAYLNAIQRIAFGKGRSEQHRKSDFVQLPATPIGCAAEPLVLRQAPIAILGCDEVTQRVASFMFGAQREQSLSALHQVARPDKVIAGPAVAPVTPWHAQARDHGTRIGLVTVGPQHHGR